MELKMMKKPVTTKAPAEQVVKDIRRATRKLHSSEEKIRIVLSGLRGEDSIAELCRKEGNAHPDNTSLEGHWRKTTALLTLYPSHLITLTPGYFWYLSLQPEFTGQVQMVLGGGLSPEFTTDPSAEEYSLVLKKLLAEVNVEDRGCTEKVFRGMSAKAAEPGHLSRLERPIYDFMQYLAERTSGFERSFAVAAE
jgi:choline monooxygenase